MRSSKDVPFIMVTYGQEKALGGVRPSLRPLYLRNSGSDPDPRSVRTARRVQDIRIWPELPPAASQQLLLSLSVALTARPDEAI